MTDRVKYLVLLAFPLFLLVLWTLSVVKPKPRTWIQQGRMPPSTNVLQLWRQADFIPIEHGSNFVTRLKGIPFIHSGALGLTDDQRQAAVEAAQNFLLAFGFKDLEAYRRFRLPVKTYTLDDGMMRFRFFRLKELFPDTEELREARTEAIIDLWFQSMFVPLDSKGTTLHEHTLQQIITGFSTYQSAFFFERRSNMPPPLNLFVTQTNNNGYFEQRSFVTFSPTPEALLAKHHALDILTMRLHIATQHDPPMPIYFRFYWDDERRKWLPVEHAIPYALQRKHNYAF